MDETRVLLAEERGIGKGLGTGIEGGKVRARIAAVSESVEARFEAGSADLTGIDDPTALRRLLRAVVTAPDSCAAFGGRQS